MAGKDVNIYVMKSFSDTLARERAVEFKKEIQLKLWKIAEHIVSEKIRLDRVTESKDQYIKHKSIIEDDWFDYMDDTLFPEDYDTFLAEKTKDGG